VQYHLLQARYQTNPGELFLYLFNNKIGSGLAILFHAWASALEQTGDTRKADAVYKQGIDSQAQPVDWLHAQHRLLATVLITSFFQLLCLFPHCFDVGIISWPKIHIDYRGNSYRDIVDQTEWEGKWEGGGRSGRVRMN